MKRWQENIDTFIELANKHNVQLLMVGGSAVQFYGYNRNSFDVDFWVNATTENLDNLVLVFKDMGYDIEDFPKAVRERKQNISIKFAPLDLDLELITNFSVNKSFEEAYKQAETLNSSVLGVSSKVLSLDDLITSKIKAGRPKDLLDIQKYINAIYLKIALNIKEKNEELYLTPTY